jgi:hypothetical protein
MHNTVLFPSFVGALTTSVGTRRWRRDELQLRHVMSKAINRRHESVAREVQRADYQISAITSLRGNWVVADNCSP